MKRLFLCLLLCSTNILFSHGFAPSTWVTLSDGTHQSLGQVCNKITKKQKVVVASTDHRYLISQKITCAGISSTNCYIRLGFDEGYDEFSQDDVVCTPLQEFYVPSRGGWTPAYMLRPGDLVAAYDGKTATVTFVQGVPQDLTVYTICVPETQIFFVGRQSVMVHNTRLPWSGAVFQPLHRF